MKTISKPQLLIKTKNQKPKTTGFTLVELLVVIVILAILATIAFLSFSSQSAAARDSTRLSDMNNISKGLSVFSATTGTLPKPDNNISILASGATIGYQGYAGANVLNMIKISNGGKDPLDTSIYYTYSTNVSQSKFQILGFLEDGSNSILSFLPRLSGEGWGESQVNADPSSYSGRYVVTKGDSIGILLDNNTKIPAQSKFVSGSFTGIDIISTSGSYSAVIDKTFTVTGTGQVLSFIKDGASRSCKELLSKDSSKKNKDGAYYINPTGTGSLQVYCDMTTDGGGWTILIDYIMGNAPQCGGSAGACPTELFDTGTISSNDYSFWSLKKLLYNGEILMKLKGTGDYVYGNNTTKKAKWSYSGSISEATYVNDLDIVYGFGWQWGSPSAGVGGKYFSLGLNQLTRI